MNCLKVFCVFGEMILIFVGIIMVWYICHIAKLIIGCYLHFHITKWLGWDEYQKDEEN